MLADVRWKNVSWRVGDFSTNTFVGTKLVH
jgi:hypothetical protein